MRPELIVGGICAGLIAVVAVAAIGRAVRSETTVDPSYVTPQVPPQPVAAPSPPTHHWVIRRGTSFGYSTALSDNDLAAGLATRALVMVDFNGIVQGDYSFTTYNPVTGNAIIMRCAEPCAYMNIMNYDHRTPETFPVTRGSVMAAMVADARAGFLNP